MKTAASVMEAAVLSYGLLPFHLAQEQQNCGGKQCGGIAQHPPQMGEYAGKISCKDRALHIDRMNEWKRLGELFECSAHQVKVKPNTGQPRGKIGKQRAADAADLFVG